MAIATELKSKFTDLLKSMFQLDQPELDFGLYRIMHAKAERINRFLDTELAQQIDAVFADADQADQNEAIESAKQKLISQLGYGAFDEEGELAEHFKTVPAAKEYLSAVKKAKTGKGNLSERAVIYDHLIRFFKRYYDGGDFMSRRYHVAENKSRAAAYAVPYDGSEVYLHWANKDQYYIKTTDSFNLYSFNIAEAAKKHAESPGQSAKTGLLDFEEAPQLANKRIHFKLVDAAQGEYNNNKESEKRQFFIRAEQPAALNDEGELEVYFEFRVAIKADTITAEKEKQLKTRFGASNKGDLPNLYITQVIQDELSAMQTEPGIDDFVAFAQILAPTDKIKQRPLITKYINNYTKKNKFDYFIHKDLAGFLQRELDFYIKNEIMRLDDIEQADDTSYTHLLKQIKVLRGVAKDIIQFLAQLENFQKKLWLKKKFVTETNYCITLDRLADQPHLLEQALNNEAQRKEWANLFDCDLNKLDHIKERGVEAILASERIKYLILDSAFFDDEFKDQLLASFDTLDEQNNGVLVNSENFHALRFMQSLYNEKVRMVYIDPPYNTGSDFIYKDSYQNSSWLSMLYDRVIEAANLLPEDGVVFVHIDDKNDENRVSHRLMTMIESIFGKNNYLDNLIWIKNTTHNDAKTFSHNHEYILAFAKKRSKSAGVEEMFRQNKPGFAEVMELVHTLNPKYPPIEEVEESLRLLYREKTAAYKREILADGGEWNDEAKKNDPWKGIKQYKLAEYRDEKGNLVPENQAKDLGAKIWVFREDNASWPNANSLTSAHKTKGDPDYRFYQPLHPITGRPCPAPKTGWRWREFSNPLKPDVESFERLTEKNEIFYGPDESKIPQKKRFLHTVETDVFKTTIVDFTDGEKELTNMFGQSGLFPNPKPTSIGRKLIEISSGYTDKVLDFFGGSGSSIQALIQQNLVDEKLRRFIAVEMGYYFDDILQKRVKKSLYSVNWKGGKAAQINNLSAAYKYIRLEQYEDTLNNLNDGRSYNPDSVPKDFMLSYLLETETAESPSLLNLEQFSQPRKYKLQIKKPNSDQSSPQVIDLVETFNWLIGLHVEKLDKWRAYDCEFEREHDLELPQDQNTRLKVTHMKQTNAYADDAPVYQVRMVEGWIRQIPGNDELRDKVLVIWRNLSDDSEKDSAFLEAIFEKQRINQSDSEFDKIYVNGPHGLQLHGSAKTRLLSLEDTFMTKMWEDA